VTIRAGFGLKAAPIMLGIRDLADPEPVRRAFKGFRYWGDPRSVCQVLAFVFQVMALAALSTATLRR